MLLVFLCSGSNTKKQVEQCALIHIFFVNGQGGGLLEHVR